MKVSIRYWLRPDVISVSRHFDNIVVGPLLSIVDIHDLIGLFLLSRPIGIAKALPRRPDLRPFQRVDCLENQQRGAEDEDVVRFAHFDRLCSKAVLTFSG